MWDAVSANADPAPGTVLLETFESGAPGWQFSGMWHIQDHPETLSVSPEIDPILVTLPDPGHLPPAFEGTHVAWFGDPTTGTFCGADFAIVPQQPKGGCTSNGPKSGYLESPSFDLSGATSAEVSFYSWWEIESVDADRYDVMTVEYSTDGGSTWTGAASLNPTNNPGGRADQSYAADGLGEPPAWHHYIADLSPAAGHPDVRLRFTFSTNDELYNGFRGWMLDNVTVSTPFAQPPPQISMLSPSCVQEGSSTLVSAYGEHFVLGSRLLIDGTQVTGATPSDERVELLASLGAGLHTVQVESPNGSISNAMNLEVSSVCGPPPGRYVALGDSYSSGEGVPPFESGTDTSLDQCHRSTAAYSRLLVERHAGGIIPATVAFWACSGSVISDFYSTNHSWAEMPQLERLLPGDATLVTLGIGGNDIGFAHIAETCLRVTAAWFPQNKNYKAECRNALNNQTMAKIANLDVGSLYEQIRSAAPHAEVYVMGYPRVLPGNPSSACKAQAYREDGSKATSTPWGSTSGFIGIETEIDEQDAIWMDTVIERLNGEIAIAAAASGFHYVENTNAFEGHDICSNNTDSSDRPWAHDLVLEDSANMPSAFSFHPNAEGQEAMETDLYSAIVGGSHMNVQQGQTNILTTLVSAGQALLNVITHWPGSDVVTTLVSPSGQEFDRSSTGLTHFATATSENYVVPDPEPGVWTITLYGANVHEGGEEARVDTSTVLKAVESPVAVVQATPNRGVAPTEVHFDGSASTAGTESPTSYVWNFGDGSPTASGVTAVHTYTSAGTYHATLTVTDTSSRKNTVAESITIAATPAAPVANITVYVDPQHDNHAYYEATKSEDIDGEIVSYKWDFGDGTGSSDAFGLHEYALNGTYTVTLTVTDNHGQSGTASQTLTVTSASPSQSSGTSNAAMLTVLTPMVPGVSQPPAITGLAESHGIWREGTRLAQISLTHKNITRRRGKQKPPVGTTFSFSLNEQALMTFSFTEQITGRRVGQTCVATSGKDAKRKTCKRTMTAGTLSFKGHSGSNKLVFQGHISRSKKLGPGRYTAIITATDSAGASTRKSLSFTIVK
jgi:PKD repeat protein/lysophospholipase L1-like esterase